jgi:hypothetical protein
VYPREPGRRLDVPRQRLHRRRRLRRDRAGAGSELLAHELGHDLALEHIDDRTADFDATNIMHSAATSAQFLTEGQLFRAHLRQNSALNLVYGARAGLADARLRPRHADARLPSIPTPLAGRRGLRHCDVLRPD